ncbi:MAG: hypothetical protein MR747_01995 [Bacteroidales bacterium]|nr:hypothetical protein [Bacteroidales bacterium]
MTQPPSKKSFFHQGFFAVKRRAVFILGAMWIALVRGWRKKGNAGRSLGLALGVGVLALEATPTIQEVGFFSIENYTI